MKRLTGKFVREARRRHARLLRVPTSSVQIYRGHEDKRGTNRYCWRHTWRIVVAGVDDGAYFMWSNIRDFVKEF
jgi:hypothetical protein